MLIDSRELPSDAEIHADVCIVGSGPAGLTLACELAGESFNVCLLESGGVEEAGGGVASMESIETSNDFVQVFFDSRHRRLGGNSRYWCVELPGESQTRLGVRHKVLDEVDFEARDWMPNSGWPFGREQLVPYYERAQRLLKMGTFAYEAAEWADADHAVLPFRSNRVTSRMFQFGLAKVIYEDLVHAVDSANNITTYLHATVTEIEVDEGGGRATGVSIRRSDGSNISVKARYIVLATGGLETAQLLLLSNRVHAAGVGNGNDVVGRFFMDHPLVYGGALFPSDPRLISRSRLYDLRNVDGSWVMGLLALSDDTLRREPLPNISAVLFPRPRHAWRAPAKRSLRSLVKGRSIAAKTLRKDLKAVIEGRRDLAAYAQAKLWSDASLPEYNWAVGGWSQLDDGALRAFDVFDVLHQVEQLPDPANRVMLDQSLDAFGRRRIRIESTWRQADADAIARAQRVFADEIKRSGLGEFRVVSDGDRPLLDTGGTAHHLGTTRMHASPSKGVVDPSCQVHGVPNLFVASSSVFPTGGFANPTFTIVALSIRIADTLKARLGPTAASASSSA